MGVNVWAKSSDYGSLKAELLEEIKIKFDEVGITIPYSKNVYQQIKKINIPKLLIDILTTLQDSGYKPYLVGGCVRDFLLNKAVKDFDIEVLVLKT